MTLTRAEVCKRYYERHKEKIKQKTKEATENDLYKERLEKYKEENKEKIKEKNKEYYELNKDTINEKNMERYYKNHQESLVRNRLSYHKNKVLKTPEEKAETKRLQQEKVKERREANKPNVIKSNRVKKWKSRGVICEDWNVLYDKYINTTNCEMCDVELIEGNFGANKKCLDHDHKTGEFRNVLCNTCNCRRL